MNDLEKLNKAIATARRVHDSIAEGRNGDIVRGAMLEALELLAKLLPQQSAPDAVRQSEPVSVVCKFDAGLVERLAVVVGDNGGESLSSAEMERIAVAVLAELAKAPCELPTKDEYATTMRDSGLVSHHIDDWTRPIERLVSARVAPALAAKAARIADLETRLAQKEREHSITIEKAADHAKRAADLEKRLAKQTPVDASGKTPGQVAYERWYPLCRQGLTLYPRGWPNDVSLRDQEIWEATAQAVLRAFGGEALRNVRNVIHENGRSVFHGDKSGVDAIDYACALIDAELAKLGAKE